MLLHSSELPPKHFPRQPYANRTMTTTKSRHITLSWSWESLQWLLSRQDLVCVISFLLSLSSQPSPLPCSPVSPCDPSSKLHPLSYSCYVLSSCYSFCLEFTSPHRGQPALPAPSQQVLQPATEMPDATNSSAHLYFPLSIPFLFYFPII